MADTLNEGRSLNSGDTSHASPHRARSLSAQRRPESELRRHMARTASVSANCFTAQRRPESELRRHDRARHAGHAVDRRSTKAGV